MSDTLTFIPEEIAERINRTADVSEIAQREGLEAKQKYGRWHCNCPACLGEQKVTIYAGKGGEPQSFKCHKCKDFKGVGAAKFLMLTKRIEYPEALHDLAKHYNIDIEEETRQRVYNGAPKNSFRDKQLLESGISPNDQRWQEKVSETKWLERDRYQAASLDKYYKIVAGDDMILHYVGLDGQPLQYKNKGGKMANLIRVRWQHPHLHLSKDGKPKKYESLYGSPSAAWLPQLLIQAFAQGLQFNTLFVSEGEKKADKMTRHGMYTVGLQGINNLNFGEMTTTFERIIQRCGVKRVVFVLDSDWHDIGSGENADYRPKSFFHAVKKFRDYFYGYKNSGIELDIFVAFGKDKVEKGIDDLLTRSLKGKESELEADFERAIIDREGKGEHVDALNITTISEHNILKLWHLQTPADFIQAHLEELKERKEFKVNGYAYHWVDDEPKLKDQIHVDEQFWTEEEILDKAGFPVTNKEGKPRVKLSFNYYNCWQFLRNRGYFLYKIKENTEGNKYRLIRVQDKIVQETDPHEIQQFVKNYVEQLGRIDVLNMLFRGGEQYLGASKLSNLWYTSPDFIQPEQETTYLVFKNCFWKITAESIEQRPLAELSRYTWESRIIDFEPKLHEKPMLDVGRKGEEWVVKESKQAQHCEMWQFYLATSNFHWRNQYELATDEEGTKFWAEKEPENGTPFYTKEQIQEMTGHAVCKMIATGYTLQGYRNKAMMKAIVAMDGMETEVGKSEGGTGKSILGTQFGMRAGKITPTFVIDGKKDVDKDPFPFDGLDERHGCIVFDDVRVNFNFEWLFSKITTMIEANWKNRTKLFLDPVPMWIITNHAIRGNSNSYLRRQYLLAFSDFFNGLRSPYDVFGHQMFDDWDWEQWNNYYNFIASCIQTYLRFNDLNKYVIPQQDLEKRKLRQEIGENFLEFAEVYFSEPDPASAVAIFGPDAASGSERGGFRNCAVEKGRVYHDYIREYPGDGKYMNVKRVKDKVAMYCKYADLDFNPCAGKDGRIKHNGTEYLVVADDKFNADNYRKIS